ncbi:unnamed protein product, partial [Rotaria sp. Silwood2]
MSEMVLFQLDCGTDLSDRQLFPPILRQ